jgi:hypothetical protein
MSVFCASLTPIFCLLSREPPALPVGAQPLGGRVGEPLGARRGGGHRPLPRVRADLSARGALAAPFWFTG